MSNTGGVDSPKSPNTLSPTSPNALSPRLSRTSVFYPNVVSAENNPHARKASDTTDISPMASRAKLEVIGEPAQTVSPLPDVVQALRDERPDSFASVDFTRRGSAAEPAGSGMPPPETTFAFETEVADETPESEQPQGRIQSTFLELPPKQHGALRSLQSPMPAGLKERMSSMDSPVRRAVDPAVRSVSPALFRSSFESESSIAESQVSATDGAEVIFQAAQQARLKRPSLVNHPAAGGSGLQLANLTKFIRDRDMQASTEEELQDTFPENLSQPKSSIGGSHIRLSDISAAASNFNRPGDASTPPSTTRRFELSSIASPAEAMTLKDALRLNPVDVAAIPKRSATVPASLGAKHKTRFAPLSITSTGAGKFRRDSVVTTPYPKQSSIIGNNDGQGSRGQAPKPIDFNLTISFRNRNSTISIPHFSSQENKTEAWWNAKEVDDERLVQLAKAEFRRLQGRVRHTMGAKTAKAVRMRFVRSNKIEYTAEPDTPLIGGRWGAYAESDFWRLWNDPSHGKSRRNWLEVLNDQTKTFGASRVFVLEVIEGYDPGRVIIAFSFITALSLVAMFLWMFLGTGGMSLNTNFSDIHGAVHVADSAIASTPGSPAAAFMFGTWILALGWTGVGAWMLIS